MRSTRSKPYIYPKHMDNIMPKVSVKEYMTHDKRRVINKEDKNLNQRIKDVKRRKQNVFVRGSKKYHVLFDSPNIKRAIIRMINKKNTTFIIGCVSWLSNKDILKALSNKKGCCIICTRDKKTKTEENQKMYAKLKPAYPGGAVRVVGDKGWNKSLMHHKFLVGLDEIGEAKWVVNGSFDMTEVATSNIENLMIIEDEDLSQCYLDEFKRVYSVSKALKINVF